MKTKPLAVGCSRNRRSSLPLLGALLGLALSFGGDLRADPAPTILTLSHTGTDFEGFQAFELEWNAVSNATYRVQVSTNLEAGSWGTVDLVTPTGNLGSYKNLRTHQRLHLNLHLYSRLVLPQPKIFTVEPAIFPSGTPVEAHVIGQCFASNDVVRVDGVAVPAMIHLNPNQFHGPLPTLSAGRHLVELVRDGVVKSSFTVTCADAVTNPELVLQGPPGTPPASPHQKISKSRSNIQNNRLGGWRDLDDDGDGTLDYPPDVSGTKISKSRSNIQNNRMGGGGGENSINSQGNRGAVIQFDVVNAKNPLGNVQPFSGEVQLGAADLVIPGRGLDFIWARTYRSRTGPSTALGQRWDFSYNVSLAAQPDGSVVLEAGNGRRDTFYPNTTGGWSRPEYFVEIGDLDVDGFPDVVTFADSGKWVFHSLFDPFAPGKLSQIIDRNGNTMKLHYDGGGRLIEVMDDLDRTNTVAYNVAGQIASVMDFSGRIVRYEYDSNGDLVTVISPAVIGTPNGNDFPGGKTNTYTYSSGYLDDRENHLLLTAKDAKGQVQYEHVYQHNQTDYDFLRCISIQRGTNVPTLFTYQPLTPTPANQFATICCLINDPVGNVTKVYYDARNRPVTMENLTGRVTPGVPVTETVNQPTGKLRSSDLDAYVTRWSWNNDSLCTLVTLPGGQKLQRIYESDFDASTPPRKRADCRVVREIASSPVDVDGDGVGDLTERAWRYEYDPRFGSDSTARKYSWRARATDRSGASAQLGSAYHDNPEIFICPSSVDYIDNPEIFICPSSLDGDDFVVSATDPRGNVTTASYDAKGNTTRWEPHKSPGLDAPELEFAYNPHGQLTAITNAADANGFRRVDTFSYYTNGPANGYLHVRDSDATSGNLIRATYDYDARGNLTRFINPRGHDTLYTYNALDQLVRYQTPTNLTARTATDFTYDANNNLVRVETERRDENDFIITSLPSRGTIRRHNALNRCTEIVQQVSASAFITNRLFYDANDNVVAVHSPLAVSGVDHHAITHFAYDERAKPLQTIAAPGSTVQSTTQWDYDANGNVTRVSEGLEGTPRITTLEYDGFAASGISFDAGARYAAAGASCQWADATQAASLQISFEHGDMSSPIVLGSVWGSASSSQGPSVNQDQGTWMDDFSDVLLSKGYLTYLSLSRNGSPDSRLSQITSPMGNVTTFNYDANDNLKVLRHFGQLNDTLGTNGNLRLAESRWKYDGLDRPIEARSAFFNPATQAPIGDGASVTTFAYAPNGQCTNVTDDLGRATRFGYDTAGRHITTTDARGNIRVAVLDAFGNCVTSTSIELSDLGGSPQVFSRTNVYDAWNRLVSTTDNLGNNDNWRFGGDDTLLRSVDARGAITRHEYDLLRRKTKTFQDMNDNDLVEAEDIVTTQTWDDNSRLSSSTDDNTNTTSYAYDSLGRQILATSPDGTAHSFAWNASNDLVREQDANGTVITNSYDLLGRCVRRDITPGPGIAATTTFEAFAYDGASRLVAATNDVSHSEFDYDSMGNCTGNHADGWNVVQADYDSVGNRVSMTYPSGRIVTYAYDVLNQMTNVSSAASAMTAPTTLATYAYEGPGRIGRIARTNGINTRYTWNGTVFPPNAAGDFGSRQISRINHSTAGGSPVIDQRRFAYDRNQNKILRAQTASFFPGGDKMTNVFHYDALNRLHEMETTLGASLRHIAYALDGNGNRQLVVSNGVALPYFMDNTPLPGPADFQMDQYSLTPFAGQAFDENGNLIAKNSTVAQLQYQYDFANRLVAVNDLITGDPAPVASYSYNAVGQRVSKTVYPPSPLAPVTTIHIRDMQAPGVEVCDDDNTDSGDGCRTLETRVGGVLMDSFIHNPDDGQIVASAGGTGTLRYYHSDDLGNVLALTDDLGMVADRYEYADFGEVSFLNSDGFPLATNAAPSGNPFLFHGMEWDAEIGLYGGGFDPLTGSVTRKHRIRGYTVNARSDTPLGVDRVLGGANNPWNGGGSPSALQKGTVKFFNEAKGFGRMSGGGGSNPWSGITVQYNPKEIGIDKSVPWTKAVRSRIPAGFVTKKNFGQLAGKK
ncbi:MAG: DUF6531 domain-containing protein [Verrucomicrobiota bacterium]